jgi:hypothetical protein
MIFDASLTLKSHATRHNYGDTILISPQAPCLVFGHLIPSRQGKN